MKTVMVFGTFDIVHAGHIRMFKQALKHGDRLVVVVARDVNVKKVKAASPLHTEQERYELLCHIDLVDKVILGHKIDPYGPIMKTKPDVVALGYDQKEYADKLSEKLAKRGLLPRVVRLKPYRKKNLKSSKIKKYIEQMI